MTGLGATLASLARKASSSPPPGRALETVSEFGDNPGGLALRVHAPAILAANPALVVVLHGCTQTAAGYAEGAGWLELADRHGFVVLCPEQTRGNNPNLCFNWFEPGDVVRGQGEAASIHAMIERCRADHGVAPGRVFVTGLSAGAAMANAMLAAYPETFAAGALVAGLPYGAAADVRQALAVMSGTPTLSAQAWGDKVRAASGHGGPWPRVSVWHGDADTTVTPGAAAAVAQQWADVHRAVGGDLGSSGARRAFAVWRDRDGRAVVELHRIAGMGHGAPLQGSGEGAVGRAGPFLLDVGVNSSLEIAQGWGIADVVVRSDAPSASPGPASPEADRAVHRRPAAQDAAAPSSDVQAVITRALRSAGLMK